MVVKMEMVKIVFVIQITK